jgi:hypothetical protein
MAKDKLTARKVETAKKPGRYGDGGGLYLQVTNAHARSWVFRYRLAGHVSKNGKPMSREMGLGSAEDLTLKEARDKALACRKLLLEGKDPIEAKQAERRGAALERAKTQTFKQCSEAYVDAHDAEWHHYRHRQQWRSSLQQYVYPVIGDFPVRSIDVELVMRVLQPIWTQKAVTAKRIQNRIRPATYPRLGARSRYSIHSKHEARN